MRSVIAGCAALAVIIPTGATAQAAQAVQKASVTVTITAEGTDMSGEVRSSRPAKCAKNRLVRVFLQIGTRGGGDDEYFAGDTTSFQNGRWVWSTGNTGFEGRFYAKVGAKPDCRPDTSPTITVQRSP